MVREIIVEPVNLEVEYVNDFIKYWESILKMVKTAEGKMIPWKKCESRLKTLLPELTKPFYEKWRELGEFSWIEAYAQSFSSFYYFFKGGGILIPKQLVLYEKTKPNNDLITALKKNPRLEELEKILYDLLIDLDIKIQNSAIKIIKKISQPNFSKSLDRFPKKKELAYVTRQDIRTVTSSMNFLFYHNILSLVYLVDLARIGYNTSFIAHKLLHREIPQPIKKYIELSFPYSTQNEIFSVLRYPYRDSEALNKICAFFDTEIQLNLKIQYQGWNLAGLTADPNSRWMILPPILRGGGSWKTRVLIGKQGMVQNLDPMFDPFGLTKRQGRLLALVHSKSTMSEKSLEKELGISRKYITEDWQILLRNRIISIFPILSNIGLNAWIFFAISLPDQNNILKVINHLKFFPFSKLFYNHEVGFIIGLIIIPSKWSYNFLFRLTSIPKEFPKAKINYYIGPDTHSPWGFDILNTFNWPE